MIDRRQILAVSAAATALAVLPVPMFAQDAAETVDELIAKFTGGAEMKDEGITMTAPEIAENGNTVPVAVDAPGATEIVIIATGNPAPEVATYKFGPLAGSQAASTRIRLAQSQDVVAIAKLADGSFGRASANIKVTIGGCGG